MIHNEQGRTMLEMLGVIAIMGIIVYGAIAGINYGMSSYKINQTYSEIQDIIQGVQDLYSWSRGYPQSKETLMEAACNNDIFVKSNTCSENENPTVSSQFGQMWIQGTTLCRDSLCQNFKIEIFVNKKEDCERLVAMEWAAINVKQDYETGSSCSESGTTLVFTPQ